MLKSLTFQITGDQLLACEGCEQHAQGLLRTLPGVKQVRAQAHDQRIDVLFDATILEPDAITIRLAEAGYEARAAVQVRSGECEQPMKTTTNKSGWLGGVTSLLGSAVGLVCPACIPALASLLASLGIGFAAKEQFIRPALVVLLVAAVAAFAWSAKLHRHWWIVASAIVGGVLVYLGRYFGFEELWMNQVALWTGAVVLVGNSVVNLQLKRGCSTCPTGPAKCAAAEQSRGDIARTKPEES